MADRVADPQREQAPILNRPLWLEHADTSFPPLVGDVEVDVAVIGAGITGVTTAYLLKKKGRSVALIEMNRIAFGATGYTTAKLTVGHGLIYARLVETFDEETARRYARANQGAIGLFAAIVGEERIDCDFESADNVVYSETDDAAADVEAEAAAARAAGVDAELTTDTDLPFSVAAAVRVPDQAQFHPWKFAATLARIVDGDGGHVFEGTRALQVRHGEPCVVETMSGRVRARHVVVATQMPFLDRGLLFARAHPEKSYAVATLVESTRAPRGMYISADRPTRSIRSAPAEDGRRVLIVGGEGHRLGADGGADATQRYERLEQFVRERFDAPEAAYRWSTHDYAPVDLLPFIGRIRPGQERILVATGFNKWGLTKGVLAAAIFRDTVLGRPNDAATLFDATRIDARRSAAALVGENARVALQFLGRRLRAQSDGERLERLAAGEGAVVRRGARHYATYRDDVGRLHVMSATCPHLGCVLDWNQADRAWECPCHGSRFAADGRLVQGPATEDLEPKDLPA
jgi:glycine/D-amino acid oxidase-like deaminating enzyme/nitrite reductase/ring-hydroxylating ferredoxin subunit